jgi:hypothetical protein
MRNKNGFPKVVKAGSATVRVYRLKHALTASGWIYAVAWGTPQGRKTVQFANEATAMDEARIKTVQLSEGQVEGAGVDRADRDVLVRAKALCGSTPILAALDEWAKARELTSNQVIPAAEAWAARTSGGLEPVTVGDASKAFIKSKNSSGVDTKASYARMFPALVEAFGERSLASLQVRELSAWLQTR